MTTTSVKVSAKYQIVVPQIVRKKLNIKKGDSLIVDVQDGIIVLIPNPKDILIICRVSMARCGKVWTSKNISTGSRMHGRIQQTVSQGKSRRSGYTHLHLFS